MNSLENPDPQSLELGRRCNQCAHSTSPFCYTSRNSLWLYLTSDRWPTPLPFPVPKRPCSCRTDRSVEVDFCRGFRLGRASCSRTVKTRLVVPQRGDSREVRNSCGVS